MPNNLEKADFQKHINGLIAIARVHAHDTIEGLRANKELSLLYKECEAKGFEYTLSSEGMVIS